MSNIIINNLSKSIKNHKVLDNVNLTFEGGNIYGLVGRNGSGKTMLLRAICGLIYPDEGSITIDSKRLHKDISFPESCGAIIEHVELLPNFTAFENLKILGKIRNTVTDEMIKKAISSVGLNPESSEKVKTYSLGMKQKLSIAQALFENPSILLLDEPTNALDEDGVKLIRNILIEEKKKGKLIIIASHNKEDLNFLSDVTIKVSDGHFSLT
jgi:ABC-2 type transport system ATP-binding protein